VEARVSLWTTRGHVFALPHDVHPVMLAYRADLVEQLGIDVETLKTWDDFTAAGRRVTADLDGDGALDRFMIDLQSGGSDYLMVLLLQRGIGLFDEQGELTFNQPATLDTLIWYLHQYYGEGRIAYDCGWGQPLAKAMSDGLVLFYIVPDWRAHLLEMESPKVSGKMKLMPLPAWEPGGRRTSVWGGSGLAVTKRGRDPELAWQFARQLYFDRAELGKRFADTSILPALKDAWALPLVRPMSAAFCLLTFLGQWNSFFGPSVFLQAQDKLTLPVVLNQYINFYRNDYGLYLAGTLLAIVPPAILFFALEKEFISGLTAGAVKG